MEKEEGTQAWGVRSSQRSQREARENFVRGLPHNGPQPQVLICISKSRHSLTAPKGEA